MQQIFKKIFALLISVIFLTNVNAASCSNEERAQLNSIVSNIKVNYEVIQVKKDPSLYEAPDAIDDLVEGKESYTGLMDAFKINILNANEKVYIEVTNNKNRDKKVYNFSNATDGTISFEQRSLIEIVTYTFKIYASSATGCEKTLLRTLYLTTPRYNEYYVYDLCQQAPEHDLCQKYVSFNLVSDASFTNRLNEYIEKREKKENKNNEKSVSNFLKEHKVTIAIGGIIIIALAGVAVTVIVKKNRRSDI